MNFELHDLLAIISVAAAVYFAFRNNTRADNNEVRSQAQVDAVLSPKLDSISDDTK